MLFSYSPALAVKHLGGRCVISLYRAQCYKSRPYGSHWIALCCIYLLQANCRAGFIFQEIRTTTENVLLKLDYYKVSLGKLIEWSVDSEMAAVERLTSESFSISLGQLKLCCKWNLRSHKLSSQIQLTTKTHFVTRSLLLVKYIGRRQNI